MNHRTLIVLCVCVCFTTNCCFLWVNTTEKTLSAEWQEQGVMVYRLLPAAEGPFSSFTPRHSHEVKRTSEALFRQQQRHTQQHSISIAHHSCPRSSFIMFITSNMIFVIEHVIISRIQTLTTAAGCHYVFTACFIWVCASGELLSTALMLQTHLHNLLCVIM